MKSIFKMMVVVLSSGSLYAQQVPLTSQYMFNNYLLNPAEAGAVDALSLALSARTQWVGFEGSPKTQFFSAHAKVGEKMGVGGYIYNDKTGPITAQGIQLSYAYHLRLNETAKLSFSLAGLILSNGIYQSELTPEDTDDNAINSLNVNTTSADINFGALYYTKKYKVGIASPQLLQSEIYSNTSESEENKPGRHYYLFGEYNFAIKDKISVIPSALIKYVAEAPIQFDLSARGVYADKYWVGLSYRYNNSMVILAGLTYKDFSFGYSYDYTITDINAHSSGGHELFLSLRMNKSKSVSSKKFD
jgi:type IX secretion system PorP/SprF family membrane protein